jgi:hypothetical protein
MFLISDTRYKRSCNLTYTVMKMDIELDINKCLL